MAPCSCRRIEFGEISRGRHIVSPFAPYLAVTAGAVYSSLAGHRKEIVLRRAPPLPRRAPVEPIHVPYL